MHRKRHPTTVRELSASQVKPRYLNPLSELLNDEKKAEDKNNSLKKNKAETLKSYETTKEILLKILKQKTLDKKYNAIKEILLVLKAIGSIIKKNKEKINFIISTLKNQKTEKEKQKIVDFVFDLLEKTKIDSSKIIEGWQGFNNFVHKVFEGNLELPIISLDKKPETKLDLRDPLAEQGGDIRSYLYLKGKSGGAQSAGPMGGEYLFAYQAPNEPVEVQRVLIKREDACAKTISEFVSGRILNALIGDLAASIVFVRADGKLDSPDETGEHVYVASIYFDGVKELFKRVYELHNERLEQESHAAKNVKEKNRILAQKLEVPDKRPVLSSNFKKIFDKEFVLPEDKNNKNKDRCAFANFYFVAVASLLIGGFDIHGANLLVTSKKPKKKDKQKQLDDREQIRKIDHAADMEGLKEDIHPHSTTEHMDPRKPGNNYKKIPSEIRHSEDMVAACQELYDQYEENPQILNAVIDQAINEVAKNYGIGPLKQYADFLGLEKEKFEKFEKENDKAEVSALIKDFIKEILYERFISLQLYAVQIKKGLLVKGDEETRKKLLDEFHRDHSSYSLINEKVRINKDNTLFARFKRSMQKKQAITDFRKMYVDRHSSSEYHAVVGSDFVKFKDVAERASHFVVRLKTLVTVEQNELTNARLLDQVKHLEKEIIRHRHQPKEREARLAFLSDRAYKKMGEVYDSLSPAKKKEYEERMMLQDKNKKSVAENEEPRSSSKSIENVPPIETQKEFMALLQSIAIVCTDIIAILATHPPLLLQLHAQTKQMNEQNNDLYAKNKSATLFGGSCTAEAAATASPITGKKPSGSTPA